MKPSDGVLDAKRSFNQETMLIDAISTFIQGAHIDDRSHLCLLSSQDIIQQGQNTFVLTPASAQLMMHDCVITE
jgi:hypothetical protein